MTNGDGGANGTPQPAGVATAGGAAAPVPPPSPRRNMSGRRGRFLRALAFAAPALVVLGALVVYPILYTFARSFYDAGGDRFVGVDNYREIFTSPRTLRAIRNNAIWVVVAPTIVTAIGLVFAVLTERVRWATAFKVAVFMPMAISFLAAGVIFRLAYEQEPERGLINAILEKGADVVRPPGTYFGARPGGDAMRPEGGGFETVSLASPGELVRLPLVGLPAQRVPADAEDARPADVTPGSIAGVVWLDFTRGGGGVRGSIDPTEVGLPGIEVQAVRDGRVVASAETEPDGSFEIADLASGSYSLRLAPSAFRRPFAGVAWLGPALVTPAIIGSYVWIWAGFAMVVIGAGLAAIPRDVQEAARTDGATEWQVFRRVTVPLLRPVLLVVFVTLVINVLKVFDLVLIIPPGSVQDDANVVALEMWRVSFGGGRDQGLGSALAVFLFLLVLPAMAFNLRRFKAES